MLSETPNRIAAVTVPRDIGWRIPAFHQAMNCLAGSGASSGRGCNLAGVTGAGSSATALKFQLPGSCRTSGNAVPDNPTEPDESTDRPHESGWARFRVWARSIQGISALAVGAVLAAAATYYLPGAFQGGGQRAPYCFLPGAPLGRCDTCQLRWIFTFYPRSVVAVSGGKRLRRITIPRVRPSAGRLGTGPRRRPRQSSDLPDHRTSESDHPGHRERNFRFRRECRAPTRGLVRLGSRMRAGDRSTYQR